MTAQPERRFYFELAEHLHGFTAYDLMDRMSSREVSEWQALFRLRKKERDLGAMAARAESNLKRR